MTLLNGTTVVEGGAFTEEKHTEIWQRRMREVRERGGQGAGAWERGGRGAAGEE